MQLITQIRQNRIKKPLRDVIAGIVVALVSIPISMGYAQIAGLPAVYGLYASCLPILFYAFLTTSPQFVVGVDAMPAAMVGGLLAVSGIALESKEAMELVPVIAILVAIWFVIFTIARAGRIVKYISTPVMGGFISGVGLTIILMQIPKLFGGKAGTGELPELLLHIREQLPKFHLLSFVLGVGTIAIILICKRLIPKVPMTVIMMGVGGLLQAVLHLDQYGVAMLPDVQKGLPHMVLPNLMVLQENPVTLIMEALSIAAVIMAQTLLATGNYASKYGDDIDNNKELLAYAGMNLASAFVGGCPINGSVSRSKIADNCGARSQVMSISASITMAIVLIWFTPLLQYLPVPVLTAIVMTALIGIVDTALAKRLWKESRSEWIIFIASLVAVLFLGTVNGVIVGCILSFWEVAVRGVTPPTSFLGRIPGHGNFHSLERNSHARPIKNTIIYRFSGNLFFANIDKFEHDIERAIKEDTRQVVVDARGIGSIDITAVDRLIAFHKKLQRRGIKFYITEHASSLNDMLRTLGGASLIDEGVVRITITLALRDVGLTKPYELEGTVANVDDDFMEAEERLAEFEWAFGEEAEERLEQLAMETADDIAKDVSSGDTEHIAVLEDHGATTHWGMLGLFDEHEFWDLLEIRLERLYEKGRISKEEMERVEERIELRRVEGIRRLGELNPKAVDALHSHRKKLLSHIRERDPELYEHLMEHNYFDGTKTENDDIETKQ